MSLDTIVNVTVSRDTRAPTQRGFGVPILVGYHSAWADRVREYSDPSEMLTDGFTVSHHLYKQATALKSQDPSLATFKIGRRANAFTQVVNFIPINTTEGFVHTLTLDGVEYEVTVQSGDAVEDIVDDFVTAMSAASDATITDGTTHGILTADTAGVVHEISVGPGMVLLDDSTFTPDDLTEDLEAIVAEDGDFYGVLIDNQSAAEIEELADWVESKVYLSLVNSADWDIADSGESGDVATTTVTNAYKRTSGLFQSTIGSWGAAAFMGNLIPRNPGSYNPAFKTLAGQAADSLSTGQQSAIRGKNWSHYTRVNGTNITYEGKTPAGEFIDIVHSIDFSTVRIQESVFNVLTGNARVPYTDTGAETIRAAVLSVLKECSSSAYPIFDPATIVVTVPKVADVSSANRANRILPSVVYQARLQGAINQVVVRGEVYV